MIPKNIFLVWFGNYTPMFVRKNAQRYMQLNIGFNVTFIHRTLTDLYSIRNGHTQCLIDELILNSYRCLKKNESMKYDAYVHELKKNISVFNIDSIVSLSDVFRLELLNTFGGIYVDCDVFQLKPFDEELLKNNRFVVKVHHTDSFFSSDNFFMGSIPQTKCDYFSTPFLNPANCTAIVQTTKNWRANTHYIANKKHFYHLEFNKITPSLDSEFYIEHYTKH